jgi:N-acetylglucosamine malate deacetylase 2
MTLAILAFFAHPDDETMLCGGTLALLAEQGADVHILIATRGEGGEMGEPPLCTREELGQMRAEELGCAVKTLGAASLTLMDYVDPTVGEGDALYPFSDNLEEVASQVMEAIRHWKVGAVITHGADGEYGHPAHKFIYQAVRLAVQSLQGQGNAPLFYTVQANYPGHPHPRLANESTPAHMVLDVTRVIGQKTQAALCHSTQHALFVRRRSEEAGRPVKVEEVIQPLESLHRVHPVFDQTGKIQDALADLLWASGSARLPDANSDIAAATG